MKTSETLNLSADLIQHHGWGKGDITWSAHAGKGLCLEGGIAAAAGIRTILINAVEVPVHSALEACPAYQAVEQYLDYRDELWRWNDTPNRTAEEVIEVLRACAVIEEARENAEVKVLEPVR